MLVHVAFKVNVHFVRPHLSFLCINLKAVMLVIQVPIGILGVLCVVL